MSSAESTPKIKSGIVRSPELADWIASRSPEELVRSLNEMPNKLRQELLAEALQDDRVRDSINSLPDAVKDIGALRKYCSLPDIYGYVKLELPGMNDGNVPSSNIIDTSSLFHVQKKRCPERPMFHHERIASRSTTVIEYTGEALYQGDWGVLHSLISISHDAFDVPHSIEAKKILSILGLSDGGYNYDKLLTSLRRLAEASIYVENRSATGMNNITIGRSEGNARQKDVVVLHLLKDFQWLRGGNKIIFSLDRRLVRLFGNGEYGLIDWDKRKRIRNNELALKLQNLISGQKANQQFHNVAKILTLSGLSCNMAEFTRLLVKALTQMVTAGIIGAFWISKPKRGEGAEKKVLCIWKKDGPSKSEPVPTNQRGQLYGVPKTPKKADPENVSIF